MIIKNKWATYLGYGYAGLFGVWAQRWLAPDAAAVAVVHAAITCTTAVQTITTGISNPDFARTLVAKTTKAGGSMAGKIVTIYGTDIRGTAISEEITCGDDTAAEGTKAFKTVSSIVIPTRVTAGDTISIGIGDKLGLEMIPYIAVAISAHHGATLEGTLPTITKGASIDLCLADFNSACGADHDQHVVYYTADRPTRLSRTS